MAEGPSYWLFVSHVLLLYVVVDQHADDDDDVDDLSQQNNRLFRPGRGKGTWFGHDQLPPSSIPSSLPYTKASVLTEAGCYFSPEAARPRASYFTRKNKKTSQNMYKPWDAVCMQREQNPEMKAPRDRATPAIIASFSRPFRTSQTLSYPLLAEGEKIKKTLLQQGTL